MRNRYLCAVTALVIGVVPWCRVMAVNLGAGSFTGEPRIVASWSETVTVVVTGDGVCLRAAASPKAEVVAQVDKGATLSASWTAGTAKAVVKDVNSMIIARNRHRLFFRYLLRFIGKSP